MVYVILLFSLRMSVRTTIDITREEAERKYVEFLFKEAANVHRLSDEDLEDKLCEHFYNYNIVQNT